MKCCQHTFIFSIDTINFIYTPVIPATKDQLFYIYTESNSMMQILWIFSQDSSQPNALRIGTNFWTIIVYILSRHG